MQVAYIDTACTLLCSVYLTTNPLHSAHIMLDREREYLPFIEYLLDLTC